MTLISWLAAAVIIAILIGIATHQRRTGPIRKRSEEHEALLAFLRDIATDLEMIDVLRQRRGISAQGLRITLERSGSMSENTLKAIIGEMMGDRIVRRQVAKFVARKGADRHKVMRELGKLTEGEWNAERS